MPKKRGNGEGCISKESKGPNKGRYRIVLTWTAGGKTIRRAKTAWKHADAVAKLEELKAERARGIVSVGKMTTADYLDHWLAMQECEESTRQWYKSAIEKHIKPGIGSIPLVTLDSLQSETWWTSFKAGDRTREACFEILADAFAQAIRSRYIMYNPFESIDKPKYEPDEIFPFTLDESKQILKTTEGTRNHIIAVLALQTGMRIGEILGLEWTKVSFRDKTIRIDQQAAELKGKVTLKKPKTRSSIRTINMTNEIATALTSHKAILLKEGNAGSPMVYPAPKGGLTNRGNVRHRWWDPLLIKLGIEHRGIHHARHTFATLALSSGVDVLVVSKTLGHSRASTTWDIYGHVVKGTEHKAVETVSKLFA